MANIGVEIDLGDDSDDDVLGLEEDENAASKMRIQFSDIDLNNTVPSAMGEKVEGEQKEGMVSGETELPGDLRTPGQGMLFRIKEVTVAMGALGLVAFGGSQAHLTILESLFVTKRQWLTPSIFQAIAMLANSLPGAASTHMVFAIAALRGGWVAGFFATLLFYLPGFIVMTLLGYFVATFNRQEWLLDAEHALGASAIGIFALSLYRIASKVLINQMAEAIAFITASVSLIVPFYVDNSRTVIWVFPILLICSVIVALVAERIHQRKSVDVVTAEGSTNDQTTSNGGTELQNNASQHSREEIWKGLGVGSAESMAELEKDISLAYAHLSTRLGIAFGVLGLLGLVMAFVFVLMREVSESDGGYSLGYWYGIFYTAGSMVFANPQAMVPFFVNDVVNHAGYRDPNNTLASTDNWSEHRDFERDLIMGFAVIQAMPGPMFNLSAYLGMLLKGLPGAIVCWIGLVLPGVLAMASALPFWKLFNEWRFMQTVMVGVNSCVVGFIIAALVHMFNVAVGEDVRKIVLAMAAFLAAYWRVPSPLIALGAAGFGMLYFIVEELS